MENRNFKKINTKSLVLAVLLVAGLTTVPSLSWAWGPRIVVDLPGAGYEYHRPPARIMVAPHNPRHYEMVESLPRGYRRVVVKGVPYYYHQGDFYRSGNHGYVVVSAPLGFTLGRLPHGYLEIQIGNVSFYYHNGNYYRWSRRHHAYEVVSAPQGAAVTYLPRGYSRVNIYGETYYKFNGTYYRMENINGDLMYVVTDI